MPAPKKPATFSVPLEPMVTRSNGPLNEQTIEQHKTVVLDKATNLLSYAGYLEDAQSWKAGRKGAPLSFEREVVGQATQAMQDARAVATSTVELTRHLKQAGVTDRMFESCVAGVKASGPVSVQDLWRQLDDTSTRQALRDAGLSDELWTALDAHVQKVNAHLSFSKGKLTFEHKDGGKAVLAPTATGMPRTLGELLRRGRFERVAAMLAQEDAPALRLVPGPPTEVEMPDVILAGAIYSVDVFARHKRSVEDSGVTTYGGNDPVTAAIVIGGLILGGALAGWLVSKYCPGPNDPPATGVKAVLCTAGSILFIIGVMLLLVLLMEGVLWLFGVSGGSDGGCGTGVMYIGADGSTGCGESSLPPGSTTLF